jgi:hypothetical protein
MLVIVPSRGRPDAMAELVTVFGDTATGDTRLLFGVDSDDPQRDNYLAPESGGLTGRVSVNVSRRAGMVGTLNRLAAMHADDYDVLAFMGDDHRPRTPGWDQRFADMLAERPGVAYGDDLLQGEALPTSAFISSGLVRALGYMAPPCLRHLYVDNAWLDFGRATNLTYLPDVVIEHVHPLAGKVEPDDGYREVNALHARDSAAYQRWRTEQWPTDRARLHGG